MAEPEIQHEGNEIVLRSAKPSWESLSAIDKADTDFLSEHVDVIDEGHFSL